MLDFIKLRGENRKKFLSAKFGYFRTMNLWMVIIACVASFTYFISDCQLFGRFANETFIPRLSPFAMMIIYILVNIKCNDYRVLSILTQLTMHSIMWATIWAIYYLPIKTHASEGFIIMHLLFLAASLASPYPVSTVSHWLVIANILISDRFNHYENLDIMLSLALPCVIAISFLSLAIGKVYFDTYTTQLELESSLVLDPLTNIYNRNILSKLTSDGKFLFDRSGNVSVLMIDIDHFKRINDTYGHKNGDEVLRSIANTLQACVRGNDYVLRWGGEEFVIFMPNCVKSEALNVAERIRIKVMNTNNNVCPITISIGVSAYDGVNYENAIKDADKALYVAKDSGRNRVMGYSKGSTTDVLIASGLSMGNY